MECFSFLGYCSTAATIMKAVCLDVSWFPRCRLALFLAVDVFRAFGVVPHG